MSNCVSFQTQLASILEVLAKTAVAEITKLVDDGSSALRLEMCRSQRENEALKRKLLLMERELKTLRGYGEGTPDNSLNISFEVQVCDEFREVPRQNADLSTERVTREQFENCGSVSMKTEDARLQSTLIKREPVDGDWSESVLLGGGWLNVDPERSQSQAEQKISEENACGTSRAAAAVAVVGEGPLCEEKELHRQPWPAGDPEKGLLVEPKQDPEGQPLTPPPPLMKVQCVWSEASRLGTVREKRGRRGGRGTQREMQMPLSSKEKSARHRERIKNDPAAREAYLAKRKESYQRRKREGKIVKLPICQLSRTEKEKVRQQWKQAQRKHRERKRTMEEILNFTPESMKWDTEMGY